MPVTLAEELLVPTAEEVCVLEVIEDCVIRELPVPETLAEEERVEILEGFAAPVLEPDGELECVPLTLIL